MHSTPDPKQADPPNVLIARADEELARAYEQIARVDEHLSNLEHYAARHRSDPQTRKRAFRAAVNNVQVPGDRSSLGGRAVRGFIGLILAACIGVVALVWQSPYGDAARQIVARLAPQLVATASLPLENPGFLSQESPTTVQAAAAEPAPPQPAPLAQTAAEGVAPTAAALSPELMQLLQSMARDLAALGQAIEQLKASQEQMARDHVNAVDLLRASQEQMARVIAKTSEAKTSEAKAPGQNPRAGVSAPPPRPT